MAILSVADLVENKEYYLNLGKDLSGSQLKPRRIRLLGIVQVSGRSEFYVVNLAKSGKRANWVTSVFGIHESGLGATEQEAIENYNKMVDMKLSRGYESDEALELDLRRVEYAPRKFTYYNYRNVKIEEE